MGKLIAFPIARLRVRQRHNSAVFSAFGELALLERAQLRLLAACTGGAMLLTAALQLAAG